MKTISTVIFCGGRGGKRLIAALTQFNKSQSKIKIDIHLIVNAYNEGLSTGIVRRTIHNLGPSDLRKNMDSLLDDRNKKYSIISKFLSIRTGQEAGIDPKDFIRLLKDIANKKFNKNIGLFSLIKQLPENFIEVISNGIQFYLKFIEKENIELNYNDFNLMNIVFAGYIKEYDNIQIASDKIAAALPLNGKVYVNSTENLFLYGLREYRQSESQTIILDESDIVAERSSVRIKRIYLLKNRLSEEDINTLNTYLPEQIESYLNERHTFPSITNEVLNIIKSAHLILYAPGTQHSSLYPTYLTKDLSELIAGNISATKIFFCNIGEDADISNYTASEIVENAFRYLSETSKEKIEFNNLFSAIIVNKPARFEKEGNKYIQPNLSYLESKYNAITHFIDPITQEKPFLLLDRSKTITLCSNIESDEPKDRGKHSIKKILNLFKYLIPEYYTDYSYYISDLTSGAILFDVDETILINRNIKDKKEKYEESLLSSPMRIILIELLEKGFKLCAITGNNVEKFKERFLKTLIESLEEKHKLHLITNFEVYANAAANHLKFNHDGTQVDDLEYNNINMLEYSDIQIIQNILEDAIKDFYNLSVISSLEEFKKYYDLEEWKYKYNPWKKKWYEKGKEIPYIERRLNDSMLTLKPIPSTYHLINKHDDDLRNYILEIIRSKFREQFGIDHGFSINAGGQSSIDITKKGINKAKAVEHYLSQHALKPEEIIYFGNEFKAGGNDQSVVDQINDISVISVNQEREETFFTSNIIYGGGRGVYSTMHHFSDILEIANESEKSYRKSRHNLKPVIQQKIFNMYEKEIEERWHQIRINSEDSLLNEINVQKQIIKEQNKKIRHFRKNITLLIPAIRANSAMESGAAKSLIKINEKLSIDYVLDNFSEFASDIIIIISPEDKTEFESIALRRKENIRLIEYTGSESEGKMILDSLKFVKDEYCDVLITWTNLIIASKEKIKEIIESHFSSEAIMTFPTTHGKNPYVRILRNKDNSIKGVNFSKDGELLESGEHDCSFFILKYNELKEGLRSLRSAFFDNNFKRYQFKDKESRDYKFLYIIEELVRESKKVLALPIAQSGEFVSFHSKEEIEEIEKKLSLKK